MKTLLKNAWLRGTLIILVLGLTIFLFAHFFLANPSSWRALLHVKFPTLFWVFGLNILQLGALVVVYDFTLQLCGARLNWQENFLLTSYSAITNFFGPLQSGPAVRAVYLKTKHDVRVRDYTLATLIYYGLFAIFNAFFLFGLSRPWPEALLIMIIVILISFFVIRAFAKRKTSDDESRFALRVKPLSGLVIATFVQVALLALCYFVEVRSIDATITLHQALIYSGAANFALFVSLTPDAIGFRESFLVLSQKLHHISTAVILAANVIDRAVYVVFLGVLFLIVLATHAKERFSSRSTVETKI